MRKESRYAGLRCGTGMAEARSSVEVRSVFRRVRKAASWAGVRLSWELWGLGSWDDTSAFRGADFAGKEGDSASF